MLSPASGQAGEIAGLFYIVFWIGVGVFVLVEGLIIYSVIRFRRRAPDEQPPQLHGSTPLEIAWTVAPAIVLVVLLAFTLRAMREITQVPTAQALGVEVIGHRWWWEFRYPDYAAITGTVPVATAGELHVPIGTPVRIAISSTDVIHSFWVPQLGGKTDAIPNHVNFQNLLVNVPGRYAGQCAEFCGQQHALMRFEVVAEDSATFMDWLHNQQAGPVAPQGDAQRGFDVFTSKACVGCHTVRGTKAAGRVGPELTHLASRRRIVADTLDNNAENLARWIRDPQGVKPGNDMPAVAMTDDELRALVAYLLTLK